MRSKCLLVLLLLNFCLTPILICAQAYTVTDLGALTPNAINDLGQIAGDLNGNAFLWSRSNGNRNLGTLPGGTHSSAAAINDFGVVAGTADGNGIVRSSLGNKQCSDLTQPFVWQGTSGIKGLGGLALYGENSYYPFLCKFIFYANDINLRGEVVGGNHDYATWKWGLLWSPDRGMSLFADAYQTSANGINGRRQIVGQTGFVTLADTSHAALWDAALKTDLGSLGGDSKDWSFCSGANAINDLRQVVGWSSTTPALGCYAHVNTSNIHAFLWDSAGGMRDLGTLPGDNASVARKINFFGKVIGDSGNLATWQDAQLGGSVLVTGRPFVWSADDGMQDLNTLISAQSGWVLESVTGINMWGEIVGSGTRYGKPHGFLLTPKDPLKTR